MNKEEMISEVERYLAHVVAKDFPLPKAIKLMYEEYKNSNKAWEKIYDEDQNYIGELKDKILDLEFKIKKQSKEIEELKENNKKLQDKGKELIFEKQELTSALLDSIPKDKIKAILEEYKYTEIGDSERIIEFYKKMQLLLEKE